MRKPPTLNPFEPWQWRFPAQPNRVWSAMSHFACFSVGTLSAIFMRYFANVEVHNREGLDILVDTSRPRDQGIISVSNHPSCLDDPLNWGVLPPSVWLNRRRVRWSLGGDNICFSRPSHALFFTLGQTIPVRRGIGVYQRGIDYAIEQLDKGAWVHIFCEGRVNQETELLRLKWGVGRLLLEPKHTPIVVPFYVRGMQRVLPNHTYFPRFGEKVHMRVGHPLDFSARVAALQKTIALEDSDEDTPTRRGARKELTDIIEVELRKLAAITEESFPFVDALPPKRVPPSQ
eukprot:m.96264 g.96264  ORF g.96264 m.96264 type:complete len:288 (+) comp13931_c0_seq3:1705-2568(+)